MRAILKENPDVKRPERKTLEARLAELAVQAAELAAHKRDLQARQRDEERRKQKKIEAIIGSTCSADASTHEIVRAALERHVRDPKSRALLTSKGWL